MLISVSKDANACTLLSVGALLETLFIVSRVEVSGDWKLELDPKGPWFYSEDIKVNGVDVLLRLIPAKRVKCPRCWQYKRQIEDRLCGRCENVVGELEAHSH